MARENNGAGAATTDEFTKANFVIVGDLFLDLIDGYFARCFFVKKIAKQALNSIKIKLTVDQISITRDASERTFHTAHIARDAFGEKFHNLFVQFNLHG